MRSIVVTITCLCFFYGCDNLFNATPTYTFSGTVVDDSTKQPLPGVGVLVARHDFGEVCEWASGKPCGSGYRPVEELRTDAQGKFRFEYETRAPNSKKHQISFEPCQEAEAECTYEAASFEVEGSWTKQVVRLHREEATVAPQIPLVELQSSFESGFGGWAVAATDTLVGGVGIPWWIRPSTSLAFEGSSALEFYMANYTDAAKIWIVRSVSVPPSLPYQVTISYAFGTADWGDANHFALISGATSVKPRTGADLSHTFVRNATGNGASTDIGYKWIQKRVDAEVVSSADGRLHVVVGVWGTWETERTYYVDALHVQIYPR